MERRKRLIPEWLITFRSEKNKRVSFDNAVIPVPQNGASPGGRGGAAAQEGVFGNEK